MLERYLARCFWAPYPQSIYWAWIEWIWYCVDSLKKPGWRFNMPSRRMISYLVKCGIVILTVRTYYSWKLPSVTNTMFFKKRASTTICPKGHDWNLVSWALPIPLFCRFVTMKQSDILNMKDPYEFYQSLGLPILVVQKKIFLEKRAKAQKQRLKDKMTPSTQIFKPMRPV